MKVVKIAVPNCYGTYDGGNEACLDSECAAAYYCRDETASKGKQETESSVDLLHRYRAEYAEQGNEESNSQDNKQENQK